MDTEKNTNDWNSIGKDRRFKFAAGAVVAAFAVFACLGVMLLSLAFSTGRQVVYLPGPQSPNGVQIAPDDAPRAQAPYDSFDRRDANGFGYGRPMRGGGFGLFSFIGGVFRLFFTIAMIVLLFALARRFLFGRRMRWAGGPGGWRGEAPPWVDDWHRKLHERMDAQERAPASDAPVTSAPEPAIRPDDAPPADTTRKPEDGPVI
jgi:hypothetical protein